MGGGGRERGRKSVPGSWPGRGRRGREGGRVRSADMADTVAAATAAAWAARRPLAASWPTRRINVTELQ